MQGVLGSVLDARKEGLAMPRETAGSPSVPPSTAAYCPIARSPGARRIAKGMPIPPVQHTDEWNLLTAASAKPADSDESHRSCRRPIGDERRTLLRPCGGIALRPLEHHHDRPQLCRARRAPARATTRAHPPISALQLPSNSWAACSAPPRAGARFIFGAYGETHRCLLRASGPAADPGAGDDG